MSGTAAKARLGQSGRTTGPRRRSAGTDPQGGAALDRLLGIALAGAVLALGFATCALAA